MCNASARPHLASDLAHVRRCAVLHDHNHDRSLDESLDHHLGGGCANSTDAASAGSGGGDGMGGGGMGGGGNLTGDEALVGSCGGLKALYNA